MELAPIVLFVYNRPEHTKKTLEALSKNLLSKDSVLYIYSDGMPENASDELVNRINKVKALLEQVDWAKELIIINRKKNLGLAQSIISGVTEVINIHKKVIVLEDDLVTSPYFLKFMNDALNYYKDEEKIWHISGWNYPIKLNYREDVFFWKIMNCWGWATWFDRWICFEKDSSKLIKTFTNQDIRKFNLDGIINVWSQVLENNNKIIDTWAVFWYATIFKNHGLCLNPTLSFVDNIGNDGSGINSAVNNVYENKYLNFKENIVFSSEIIEHQKTIKKLKNYYSVSIFNIIKNKFLK